MKPVACYNGSGDRTHKQTEIWHNEVQHKRDVTLDYAKGIAISLIVTGHLYFYTDKYDGSVIFELCHVVQLPIFFYVSGLLYARTFSKRGHPNLVNKSIRLLLPFCSFYLIWGLIDTRNFLVFITDEFKLGYWFVLVLFEMMLLFSSVCKLPHNSVSPWPHLLFYLLLTLYEGFVPKGNMVNLIFSINLLWHYYPFFLFGVYSDKVQCLMEPRHTAVYLAVFAIAFYCYFSLGLKSLVPICNLSSLLLLIAFLHHHVYPGKRVVSIIGRHSMQIYLLHFLVLKIICPYLQVVESRWLEFIYYVFMALAIIVFTITISEILGKNRWLALFLFGVKKENHKHLKRA